MSIADRKRRYRQRKTAADAAVLAGLRARGSSCGNCLSFEFVHSLGKYVCQLNSGFSGYQLAKADELCVYHHETTHPTPREIFPVKP